MTSGVQCQSYWGVNPVCNVLIGFKNHTKHLTRSAYLSFPVKGEPEICRLLLLMSTGKFKNSDVNRFPERVFEQLINYEFLKPKHAYTLKEKIKHRLNLLNESRKTIVTYKDEQYYVTSFCFMAFYKQAEGDYISEKVILPRWFKKLSDGAYRLVAGGLDVSGFDSFPSRLKKQLQKYGLVSKQSEIYLLEKFFKSHCVLSKQLLDELPAHYANKIPVVASKTAEYQLNSKLIFADDAGLPTAEMKALFGDSAWVEFSMPSIMVANPVNGVRSFYWLDDSQMECLRRLRNGDISLAALDHDALFLFNSVRIVYTPEQLHAWRLEWESQIKQAKDQLNKLGYIQLDSVLSPVDFAIARLYLRHMKEKKLLIKDKMNGSVEGRYWIHRDPFVFYLQSQINTQLNQIMPAPIKPGHNALSVYNQGATLPIHRDDVLAFSWVFSLSIETSPYKERDHAWPIHVDTGEQKVSCKLRSGDGVLINPQMEHWRDKLKDHSLNILFLWFVPQQFEGYLNGNWVD